MEEKMRILNMVSEGKISPEEAEKLMNALEAEKAPVSASSGIYENLENKFLYIQVDPKNGKSSDRVSVKVPFALVKAGLNISGLIPEEAHEKINESMGEKGFNFNFKDLNKENISDILKALEQFTVDIDTEDASVQVFCK